jgi:ParB family chromosome partitioning protein
VKKLGSDFVVDDDLAEKVNHQLINQSLTNEHYTPSIYVEAAREVMNGIDLDPASCAKANEVVRAKHFFSQSQDGLSQEWHGSVWLNPPYGGNAGDFVAKLKVELAAGRVTEAVVLVNSNCTDTKWFQPLWDGVLCFTDHRINFYGGETERSGATHGSVFSYFGPRPVDFANIFRRFGAVVKRVAL